MKKVSELFEPVDELNRIGAGSFIRANGQLHLVFKTIEGWVTLVNLASSLQWQNSVTTPVDPYKLSREEAVEMLNINYKKAELITKEEALRELLGDRS